MTDNSKPSALKPQSNADRLLKHLKGIVKLTKSSSIDPQNTGLQPVANPPCWASETAASLNLTMPLP